MIASEIIGVGSYVPPKVVTNQDLEKLLDTSHDWIIQRTGIEERRWVDEHESTSGLALKASLKAIEHAQIDKSQIDMIIFATLSPDYDFPGTGCFLQHKLGLGPVAVLDIRQQCTGFLYGLSIADNFIKAGTHKNILVVGAEIHSKGLDKTPEGRTVTVLFGDGAGAFIVGRKEIKNPKVDSCIIGHDLFAQGEHAKELWIEAPGNAIGAERLNEKMLQEKKHYPVMNGKVVFVHAVKRMSECLTLTLKKHSLTIADIDCFLFHQANLRINSKVAEILEIPEEKIFNTIQKFGNTTAATIPLGMHEAIKAEKIKKGDLVASAAFGSGFTWASAVFRY
jgi:3-oxoacyl-[acyl-carrier-protein] synthase-3